MEFREYKIMYEAEDTHWWYRGLRAVMSSLLTLDRAPRSIKILDAGSGTGGNLAALRAAGFGHLNGFDYSADAVHFCHLRGLSQVIRGSVVHVPYSDSVFDIVISCDVVNDEGVPDDMAALREYNRVLRPGGKLFLNLPAFSFLRGEHDRATSVARRYTRQQVATMLLRAGFTPRRLTYWNMLLLPVVFAVRRLRGRGKGLQEAARSDIALPPRPLNALLFAAVSLESLLVAKGGLPVGSSLAVVGVKHAPRPIRYA